MNCLQSLGLADVSAAEGCIVYCVVTRRGVLYLIDVYANSENEDLTNAERHEIRKLVAALEAEESCAWPAARCWPQSRSNDDSGDCRPIGKRRPLSCGLRRSKASSAKSVWRTWRHKVAS